MQEGKKQGCQENISIEEYLCKRQKLKEKTGKRRQGKEKSSVFFLQNFLYSD